MLPDSLRPQAKGYDEAGASKTRRALKGFTAKSGSPREDIDNSLDTLRQRSRMLYMSSPVATSAINTNRTKVVGMGLTLKSTVNRDVLGLSQEAAKEWQHKTEAEFGLWANKRQNCDALGLNNFAALQQLALKSWLLSGDAFVLFRHEKPAPLNPYGLRLHVIEADRVCTRSGIYGGRTITGATEGVVPDGEPGAGNRIHDGVEVNSSGRVVAYHICDHFPGDWVRGAMKWTRVAATGSRTGLPNVLHIMDSERPDQYRGVPYLSQVIEPLLQLRRYTESELWAALIQTFFTAWIETESNKMDMPFDEIGSGEGSEGDAPTGTISDDDHEYEMGPGSVFHLGVGETVKFGNPNVPSAGFEKFFETMCREMGAALELPSDVLLKKFDASYSAARGALLEAWEAVKMRRAWFVDDMCQPTYEVWLAEAVARGRIKAPGFFDDPLLRAAWCDAQWMGPVQSQLDPKKEAEAAILLINRGIKTHAQVTREMTGGDWEENIEILADENKRLTAAGGNRVTQVSAGDDNDEKGDNDNGKA